jgi:hypothetical protein
MAQKQVLGLKAMPRLEQIAEEYSENARRMASITSDDALILPHRMNKAPDGVFGKDRPRTRVE